MALAFLRRGFPVTLEMTATLPAPPSVVWDLITDWENLGEWMLEASDFVITSEHRTGVGVEGEATIRIAGVRTRDRIRVTRWEEELALTIEHLGWVSGSGEMHLEPVPPASTLLRWREELWPPLGPMGAGGLLAFRPLMLGIFRRDLKVLSALARARAGA